MCKENAIYLSPSRSVDFQRFILSHSCVVQHFSQFRKQHPTWSAFLDAVLIVFRCNLNILLLSLFWKLSWESYCYNLNIMNWCFRHFFPNLFHTHWLVKPSYWRICFWTICLYCSLSETGVRIFNSCISLLRSPVFSWKVWVPVQRRKGSSEMIQWYNPTTDPTFKVGRFPKIHYIFWFVKYQIGKDRTFWFVFIWQYILAHIFSLRCKWYERFSRGSFGR